MPQIVEKLVSKLLAKGMPKSEAYAIANKQLKTTKKKPNKKEKKSK